MSNAKVTIKIFMPLEVQPEPVYGAEDLWLSWQDDDILIDNFGWYVGDKVEHPPIGGVYTDGTADELGLYVNSADSCLVDIPFFVTSAKVVCQNGVWGWLTEAEEAQL
jgi:hypothetical protein